MNIYFKNTLYVKKCCQTLWITSFDSHNSFGGNYYCVDKETETNKNEIGAGHKTLEDCAMYLTLLSAWIVDLCAKRSEMARLFGDN